MTPKHLTKQFENNRSNLDGGKYFFDCNVAATKLFKLQHICTLTVGLSFSRAAPCPLALTPSLRL